MPRVTVAIPTFNRDRWLGGAIESVLAQEFEDLKLLVSDNASTDATPEVVAGFRDERLEYVRLPMNVGLLENHNQVFRRIETDYLLILPDDDRIKPDLLARTVPVLDAHPRVGMVHTGIDVLGGAGEAIVHGENWTAGLTADTVETGSTFLRESMLHSCRVCASSALTRTAALPPTLFEPEEFPPIDFGMWLRIALDWDIAFLADPLACYRIHDESHSSAAGVGRPVGVGYAQGVDLIDKLLEVKRRFLARHAERLDRPRELARLAARGYRLDLLNSARNATLPERGLRRTAGALAGIAGHEPRILADPRAWRLLAGGVAAGRTLRSRRARDEARAV